jgi:uncharacterized membrane protein YeaQ/YmgE (transglycosylase-associated protein family)
MKSIIFAVVYGFIVGVICSFLFENSMWLIPYVMGVILGAGVGYLSFNY